MKKNMVLIFFLMLVTIIISIFSLSKTVEVENVVKSQEEIIDSSFSVKILPDRTSGSAPLEIKFGSITLNAKSTVKYYWDFGDGQSSNESNPTHTYYEVGPYVSKLTVIDNQNRKVTEQTNITVLKNNPPIVEIIVNKVGGNRPVKINFDCNCFDVDGKIISYKWEITDPPLFSKQKVHKYDVKNFSRLFIRNGLYEVKLTVVDDGNNSVVKYLKLNILKNKIELLASSFTYYVTLFSGPIKSVINIVERGPNAPTSPSPTDNSTDVNLSVNLSWICIDRTPLDKLTFDIYFGTTNPPPLIISQHKKTNLSLGIQLSNTTFYWKIVAKDKHGKTKTSPIWSFKTQ